jgi:DNA-binding IclR family transcriptional regulator
VEKPKLLLIDEILELLKNGEWHELKEIAEKTRLKDLKVELITTFLAEYDFLEFDKKCRRIRLSPQLRLFLKKLERVENEEHIGKKERVAINLFLL